MTERLPALVESPVDLAPLLGDSRLWAVLIELAKALPADGWLLIGGQMVALHGFIAGRIPPRTTMDIDIVANVLVRHDSFQRCIDAIEAMELVAQPSITGMALHRFVGERATVDLMIPDHLPAGLAARLRRARAVSIDGGQRAMNRAGRVPVSLGSAMADIVVPDLVGTLVLKARAALADQRDAQRHHSDIAFLASLIDDPLATAARLDPKERRSLRRVPLSNDARSEPWVQLSPAERADAFEAWEQLIR